MRHSIMNSKGRYPRLGTVAALALALASGVGCSVQSSTNPAELAGSQGAQISVPLAKVGSTAALQFASKGNGIVTITMADETAELYMSSVDSSLWVNGVQVVDTANSNTVAIVGGAKANVKGISVVSTTSLTGDVVILNYMNGLFGLGTSTTAGTTVSLTHGMNNSLIIKGTSGNDSFAFGAASNAGAVSISLTNSAKAPTKDILPTNISTYSVDMGAGNDTFTSAGNAATGLYAFGKGAGTPAVSVYGNDGNDTLVESAVVTPNETFSGGAGTDTVDFSARVQTAGTTFVGPVYATLDPTGSTTTSGAVTMGTCDTTVMNNTCVAPGVVATQANTPIGSPMLAVPMGGVVAVPTVTEGDYILDTEVILGTAGGDYLAGGPGCTSVTLNGGLGNDTFLEGPTSSTLGSGSEILVGGGGIDLVDYSLRSNALTVVMDNKTASGDPIAVTPASGPFSGQTCVEADTIGTDVANINLGNVGGSYTGNALNNVFYTLAGTGANSVFGLAGDDTLNEGAASNGAETFAGGLGTDTVDYAGRSAAVTVVMDGATTSGASAGAEGDLIGTDVENLYGGTAADSLTGNAADNDIEGNGGGDTICGLAGNDTLLGNAAIGSSTSFAQLHGSDCADTVVDTGYNVCLNTGATGVVTSGVSANGVIPVAAGLSYCQVVTH
jgi:hypothetical protein